MNKCLAAIGLFALLLTDASANLITNGDFSDGLNGWKAYRNTNGTTKVVATTIAGYSAAQFHVGELTYTGKQTGGGIYQKFTSAAGEITLSADTLVLTSQSNKSSGVFSMLLDSVVVAKFSYGYMPQYSVAEHLLEYTGEIAAGTHELRFLITRPYLALKTTPNQYLFNVQADVSVPEPGSLFLMGVGLIGAAAARRRAVTRNKS